MLSRAASTPRLLAMADEDNCDPLNCSTDVRETTRSALIWPRVVMSESCRPVRDARPIGCTRQFNDREYGN